jgi:Zn-dependent protease with chaperone function
MILALCVLLVVAVAAAAGPAVLSRLTRSTRSPFAILAAWQISTSFVAFGAILGSAMVAAPTLISFGRLPLQLESCLVVLRHSDRSSPASVRLVAGLLVAGCLTRLSLTVLKTVKDTHRRRGRHRALLNIVSRAHIELGVRVIDDEAAAVYCMPGGGGTVVFTSAALNLLSRAQQHAVLAHERAHLRGHHHLVIGWANLLATAFPRVRLLREANIHTARLIEMRADDVAARDHGRQSVAEALFALSDTSGPAAALSAAGVVTEQRIARLLMRAPQAGSKTRLRRTVGACGGAAVYALFAASPVILAIASHAALCLV